LVVRPKGTPRSKGEGRRKRSKKKKKKKTDGGFRKSAWGGSYRRTEHFHPRKSWHSLLMSAIPIPGGRG